MSTCIQYIHTYICIWSTVRELKRALYGRNLLRCCTCSLLPVQVSKIMRQRFKCRELLEDCSVWRQEICILICGVDAIFISLMDRNRLGEVLLSTFTLLRGVGDVQRQRTASSEHLLNGNVCVIYENAIN
ncbi:unnamed protein product [Ceratitis capitata]|uniref:(Mediterranean fruit fly) hypothetical protein n=1 Tax=Ceratitis capitata TaxID=7213 RepID=A0A811U3D3_CERCA|nr:unnamed protein product [Ceratitis capitata]